ncbi:MAG: aldolase/citrate lyase family protein, partial [Halobacteriales archaeon]|nr:aldolase/citrate lyase family protein [Halobacteriales archaeon]
PRVETAAEVRRAVEASRFAYDGGPGQRGVGSARGSSWGAAIDGPWLDREDDTALVGIMFENTKALSNIDEILATPDLGFVFIGSNDLSVSLGCPLEFDHPDFVDALATIRDSCANAGVPYGQLGVSLRRAEETVAEGGQLVSVGSDLGAIRSHMDGELEDGIV